MADDTRSEQCLPIEYPMADREGFCLANASVCEKLQAMPTFTNPHPFQAISKMKTKSNSLLYSRKFSRDKTFADQ